MRCEENLWGKRMQTCGQADYRAMVVAAADDGFAAVAVLNGGGVGGVGSNKFIYLSQSQKKANELTV